jgi:hypothetical protein
MKERSLKEEALVNEITTEWAKVKQDERSTNHTLENLITKKKLEYCLEDVTVTKSCIRKRLTRKRLICARNPGSASPMKPVEEYLVSIFNKMAKMRQPLCISEGLALANSLVAGTKWEKEIFHFKTKRGWNQFDKEGNKKELLVTSGIRASGNGTGTSSKEKPPKSLLRIDPSSRSTGTLLKCMTKFTTQT